MYNSKLEVVLKLTERCNLNCSYCYVFNGINDSYKNHPPILSPQKCLSVAKYLQEACKSLSIKKLQIDFHGGEPLLIGKRRFSEYCEIFHTFLNPIVELSFAIQTNATLVDNEWIKIFSKYKVSPGVSLDGNKVLNDKNRIDLKGRGTYDSTIAGFNLLKLAYEQRKIDSLGVLCVIHPQSNATKIYNHFVHDLGIKTMDFLLPDLTHNTIGHRDKELDGKFLCELFDSWAMDENPEIFIRILNSIVSLMFGGRSKVIGFGKESLVAIGISTDGGVGPDDTLRSCGTEYYSTEYNVENSTLKDFLLSEKMKDILQAQMNTPEKCSNCCWEQICGGGHLIHRFSKENGFNNESILCESLKKIYAHVGSYLINNGMPFHLLEKNLKL